MSAINKLPTGVPGLDVITYGGIPQGRTTLITGKSGAGEGCGLPVMIVKVANISGLSRRSGLSTSLRTASRRVAGSRLEAM